MDLVPSEGSLGGGAGTFSGSHQAFLASQKQRPGRLLHAWQKGQATVGGIHKCTKNNTGNMEETRSQATGVERVDTNN